MSDVRTVARRAAGVVVVLAAGFLAGCGGPAETPGHTPEQEELLKEVWDMYKAHVDDRKRSPARLADLDPYEPAAIHGYVAVRDGEVVLLFGGPTAGGTVLAYEKKVPQEGGAVLLRNGTVRQMTAEEFGAAHPVRDGS